MDSIYLIWSIPILLALIIGAMACKAILLTVPGLGVASVIPPMTLTGD